MPQIYSTIPTNEPSASISTPAEASPTPSLASLSTDSESEDSIFLSNLVRQGEASRLRRRGAMRLDHNHLQNHHALAFGMHPTTTSSEGEASNVTGDTTIGGPLYRTASPGAASFVLVEREGWMGWEEGETNQGTGAPVGSGGSSAQSNMARRSRRLHRMTRRRYGPYGNVHGDAETEDGEDNSYTLVCGAPDDSPYEPGVVPPFKPSALPLDPPSLSSPSSAFKGLPGQDEPRTSGCGAIIHLNAAPRPRLRVWTARSPATSAIVPLDASYFETSEAARFTRNACGCIKEGIGCAVCGNPLGIRYVPCKLASEHFFSSRHENKHCSAQGSNSYESPWRIRAPEGAAYWHSFPHTPSSSSSSSSHPDPSHAIYTIFSNSVTSHPSYTFPPNVSPNARHSRMMRYVLQSDSSDSDSDEVVVPRLPVQVPEPSSLPIPVYTFAGEVMNESGSGNPIPIAGGEGASSGAVEVTVATTTTQTATVNGGDSQEAILYPGGMILDRFAALSPLPFVESENENGVEGAYRGDRGGRDVTGPYWHHIDPSHDHVHSPISAPAWPERFSAPLPQLYVPSPSPPPLQTFQGFQPSESHPAQSIFTTLDLLQSPPSPPLPLFLPPLDDERDDHGGESDEASRARSGWGLSTPNIYPSPLRSQFTPPPMRPMPSQDVGHLPAASSSVGMDEGGDMGAGERRATNDGLDAGVSGRDSSEIRHGSPPLLPIRPQLPPDIIFIDYSSDESSARSQSPDFDTPWTRPVSDRVADRRMAGHDSGHVGPGVGEYWNMDADGNVYGGDGDGAHEWVGGDDPDYAKFEYAGGHQGGVRGRGADWMFSR